MPIGSILLGATLLILVGLFLARPFLLSHARFGKQMSPRQELLAQKEAVLAQIQVLEFDYETGDLPDLDYKQQRQQLVAEAAEILKKLDELPETDKTAPKKRTDEEIEAAVARRRRRKPRPASPAPVKATQQPQPPPPAASSKAVQTNGRIKFCPQCGQPVDKSDNFCAYCGHKIHQPQPS